MTVFKRVSVVILIFTILYLKVQQLSRISHPSIIKLYGACTTQDPVSFNLLSVHMACCYSFL